MARAKTLSTKIIHANPWWTYKHDRYCLASGTEADYYYGENNGSIMVVGVLDDGRLVLEAQYRYLRGKLSVEFPCGSINPGEQPAEAAARELREETGYGAEELIKVGEFDALNGLFKDTTHVFIAKGLFRKQDPALDESEEIEVIYRRSDELEDMLKRGEIWDGQTIAAWALIRDRMV